MAGLAIYQTVEGIPRVVEILSGVANFELDDLAYNIGALLESATQERIAEEKSGPGGEAWPAWSPGYAATRHGGHSLLMGEGMLQGSIQNHSEGPAAIVGTNLVYGAIHQFGGEEVGSNIPARPYLGVSEQDGRDVEELVSDHLARIFG